MKYLLHLLLLLTTCYISPAQKNDTVYINGTNIKTRYLTEGGNSYLVYAKLGKDAPRILTQFWKREIKAGTYNGKKVIIVKQVWEDKDSIIHTAYSICDRITFKPILHEFWWKQKGTTRVHIDSNYIKQENEFITTIDTARQKLLLLTAFKAGQDKYFLNWHLDLEVFSTLPYRKNVTFIIPFYDVGTSLPLADYAYTVTGSDILTGYNHQKIDCWLLSHESKGAKEIFWISKKNREVLKLQQGANGKYRYKIKLGFTD